MHRSTSYVLFLFFMKCTTAEYALYDCPSGWDDFEDHCYRSVLDRVTVTDAKARCKELGDKAFLLSVNSEREHIFVTTTLNKVHDKGQLKRDWWTSGRRVSERDSLSFYWEGDGKPIESYFYWHNSSIPRQTDKNNILYNYNGYKWGWILGTGTEKNPFTCKIAKEDIYRITEEERGPDYGVDNPDPAAVPRGPYFTQQPQNKIFEKVQYEKIVNNMVALDCMASGVPAPTYKWFKQRTDMEAELDPLSNNRYTMINGRLVIHKPTVQQGDDGLYYCKAENKFGTIVSNTMKLEFGFISDFPKDQRSPVNILSYQWGSIECSPPAHYPEITYSWFKDDQSNWVRPQLKPYIFISHDGRLYFSEVTLDDVGAYYCMVNRPGITWSSGATSMPTRLQITEGSPGTYEPEIQSGFPKVFPANPMVGQNIRLECFASGTSRPPLQYYWEKIETLPDGRVRVLPLPDNAQLADHNRVLNIRNVGMYNGGTYRCRCTRPYGLTNIKDIRVILQATPYFVTSLKHQFLDEGSTLRWRCEAGGSPQPSYFWLKNSQPLNNATITDPDKVQVTQNVLTIMNATGSRDDGMYQCGASNIYGTRYSTAELRVLAFPPKFSKYPLQANQFATMSGNTTLLCKPEAAPRAEIIWYKDNAILNAGADDMARVRKMPNGNLFISSVQQSDAGVYKCRATNRLGMAESQGNLTVLNSVTISYPPFSPTIIKVNKTAFLHCIASYNPQLDVTYVWYHGDLLVEFEKVYRLGENRYEVWQSPHYRRGSGHYVGGIYIMNANYGLTGRYTCVVESTNGDRFSRAADVRIVGPPSEPAGVYVVAATTTTTSAVIQWIGAGDNGKPISSYVIETYNHWERFWRIHETNVRQTPANAAKGIMRYNVTGLRPYSQYQIRMRAENDYGTSIASVPSETFWTASVLPDHYPAEVGGGGGKVGDLVITWKPMDPWEHNGKKFGYRVFYKNAGDQEWGERKVEVGPDVSRTVILVGEQNFYMPYDVAVQGFNEEGDGPISPATTIRSAMKLPSIVAKNVRAQPMNATSCLVTWEKVVANKDQSGGMLRGYRVAYWLEKYGPILENAPRVTINGRDLQEGLVIGILPDTRYNFGVYVWNDAGNGPISDHFTQRTLRLAPINQPTEVHVYQLSRSSVHVYFRGVSTTNKEEPLIGYKVRVWPLGTDIKNATDYNAKKENDLVIRGLHPEIHYKLRVFGYSRGGDGTMSSPAVEFQLGTASRIGASLILLIISSIVTLRNELIT